MGVCDMSIPEFATTSHLCACLYIFDYPPYHNLKLACIEVDPQMFHAAEGTEESFWYPCGEIYILFQDGSPLSHCAIEVDQ